MKPLAILTRRLKIWHELNATDDRLKCVSTPKTLVRLIEPSTLTLKTQEAETLLGAKKGKEADRLYFFFSSLTRTGPDMLLSLN